MRDEAGVDDEMFQALLDRVRSLHSRTGRLTRSTSRIHDNIRARLSWNVAPTLPDDQRRLADEVVEMLGWPRLAPSQSRQLYDTYFGAGSILGRRDEKRAGRPQPIGDLTEVAGGRKPQPSESR
jgi:hypothetical protein